MHITWDDIQTVETLVRTGNIVAAAKSLSIQHSSVSRRITALEESLGTPLFLRGRRLTPTSLARTIADHAVEMAAGARRVELALQAERYAREQRLIITTSDALAPLVVSSLSSCASDHCVRLIVSDVEKELEPGVTDLAVRPSAAPQASLHGSRLGKLRIAVYRARSLPSNTSTWVLPSPGLRNRPSTRWVRGVPRNAHGRIECDSIIAMRDACILGLGRAVLPSFLVANDPRLIEEETVPGGTPVWVLSAGTKRAGSPLQKVATLIATSLRARKGIWEE